MNHDKQTHHSVRRMLIVAAAVAAAAVFSASAQAQTCTTDNWSNGAGAEGSPTAGKQDGSGDFRRYGGPCGLRIDVAGSGEWLTDNSPATEVGYIARFYAFLDDAGTNPVMLFAADDGTDDQIQVTYNAPSAGDLTLTVYDQGAGAHELTFPAVGAGWHSIELFWEQAGSAAIAFSVDGEPDETATVDTTGIEINNAHLGNVNAAGGGGTLDFDDFDSRRQDRPGRLVVGDADDDGGVNIFDAVAVLDEFQTDPPVYAAGQPDCDEDGSINIFDAVCVIDIFQ